MLAVSSRMGSIMGLTCLKLGRIKKKENRSGRARNIFGARKNSRANPKQTAPNISSTVNDTVKHGFMSNVARFRLCAAYMEGSEVTVSTAAFLEGP
jgi:hypothetical protein